MAKQHLTAIAREHVDGSGVPALSSKVWLSLAFLVGLSVRLVPEVFAGPNGLVGYDLAAYYAPLLYGKEHIFTNWRLLFAAPYAPLFYLLWVPPEYVFPVLRIVAVLSYGFLAAAVYLFVKERIGLDPKWAFFASVFLCLQLATLRLGWDLLKNTLALVFALVILSGRFRQSSLSVRLLTVAVALTHELVAAILGGIWVLQLLAESGKPTMNPGERNATAQNLVLIIGSVVAAVILADSFYFQGASGTVYYVPFRANCCTSLGNPLQPIVNYLTVYSYGQMANMVVQLTVFLLYPILVVLALFGLKKDRNLLGWVVVTALAGFSPIFSPTYAVDLWYRWLFLLVFPLGIYAILGIRKILTRLVNFRPAVGVLFIVLTLSPFLWFAGNFMLVPPEYASPYFTNPAILPMFPSSMLQNTVPFSETGDVQKAVEALNKMMTSDSVVLVHESFFGWVSIGLTGNKTIINYLLGTPADALPTAKALGFKTIYWVWWAPGISWDNYQAPTQIFTPVYTSGKIAVYLYVGS
jgi:hypothetical protein